MVSARPFRKSQQAWLQQLGRGLRPYDGKEFVLLLDHAGNHTRHLDFVEEFWANGHDELDMGRGKKKAKKQKRETVERECLGCGFVMSSKMFQCPQCGMIRKKAVDVEKVAGKLEKVQGRKEKSWDQTLWRQICCRAVERAKDIRWAKAQYKNIVGAWPIRNADFDPAESCPKEVALEITKNLKAYARRMNELRS